MSTRTPWNERCCEAVASELVNLLQRRRALNWAGFGACVALMGYALYAEILLGLEPCPLCVFQRIAVMVLGAVFLVAALHHPRSRGGARLYAGLIGLAALGGAAVAGQHVRLQNMPADQVPACGPGLEFMLDVFPLHEAVRMVFTGSGECAEVDWSLLGLSMPAWVLVACLGLGVLGVVVNWRRGGAGL
jgi:protein dithiol:quinone oxidoreductase